MGIKNLSRIIDGWSRQQDRRRARKWLNRHDFIFWDSKDLLSFLEKTSGNFSLTRAVIEPFYMLRWDYKILKEEKTGIPHKLFVYGATLAIDAARVGAYAYFVNGILNCVKQQ